MANNIFQAYNIGIRIVNLLLTVIDKSGFKLIFDKEEQIFRLQDKDNLAERNWIRCRTYSDIKKRMKE